MKKIIQKLRENKKRRLIVIVTPIIIAFFICSGIIASQVSDINRLSKQKESYEAQLEAQQNENARLEGILESDNKDGYIEQKAREKGYVKSDEIVFYNVSGSNAD